MYSHFLTTISLFLFSYGKLDNCSFSFYGCTAKFMELPHHKLTICGNRSKRRRKIIIIFKCYWSIFRLTILYNFLRNYLILISFTYFFPVFSHSFVRFVSIPARKCLNFFSFLCERRKKIELREKKVLYEALGISIRTGGLIWYEK